MMMMMTAQTSSGECSVCHAVRQPHTSESIATDLGSTLILDQTDRQLQYDHTFHRQPIFVLVALYRLVEKQNCKDIVIIK